MTNSTRLHKSTPAFVVKIDDTTEGVATAIVSVFGVVDSANDVIHPGAFTKTLVERGRRLRVLDMHNTNSVSNVVGKVMEIKEVGRGDLPQQILDRFPEATGGLSVTIKFALNTPQGRTTFDLLTEDYINEFSIGFEILDSDNSVIERAGRKVRIRNIRTIRLWEVSPVIWGANPATDVVEVRADEAAEAATEVRELIGEEFVQRLGDQLHAVLLKTATSCLASWYSMGVVDTPGFDTLVAYCTERLATLRSEMPEDLALTQLPGMMSGLYPSDSSDLELRAGRVLSSTNYNKVRQASLLLNEVLESADLRDGKDEKSGDTPTAPAPELVAGPPATDEQAPTTDAPVEAARRRLSALEQRLTLLAQLGEITTDA